MKRRVIQIAGSTQLVSLPRKWALAHNIQKGDEMEVTEEGNKVIVSTDKGPKLDKIEVDVSGMNERVLNWVIFSLHKSGYDEIELKFDNPKDIGTIQERLKELLGYVIIQQSEKRCTIRSISQVLEKEFDPTLRRAFLVTQSMADSTLEIMKSGDKSGLKDLISLESTNNQLTGFCHRILNKKGYSKYNKTTYIYVIIWQLESIADDLKVICSAYSEPGLNKIKISKEAIAMFERVNELLKTFYELFYEHDQKKLVKISEERTEIPKMGFELIKEGKKEEIVLVHSLLNISQRVIDSMGSYVGTRY